MKIKRNNIIFKQQNTIVRSRDEDTFSDLNYIYRFRGDSLSKLVRDSKYPSRMILMFAHEFTYVCICMYMYVYVYMLSLARPFILQRSIFHLLRFRYGSSIPGFFHIFRSLLLSFSFRKRGDACLEAIENIKYKTSQLKSLRISCIRFALITDLLIIHLI